MNQQQQQQQQQQQTIEHMRERGFHTRIKKLLTKSMQDLVMGAFREAMAVAEQAQLEQDKLIPDADELTRLRRLMKALGYTDAFDYPEEDIRGVMFTVLGQAAGTIERLEALRPHWAMGYTSDGVAAQCSSDALSTLWKLLGAQNQTQAVGKLQKLISVAAFNDNGTNSKGPQ